MKGRLPVAAAIAVVTTAAVAAGTASAATIPVPCSTPDLVAAINQANATAEPDTLELTSGCTYHVTTPSFVGTPAGNNVGLPLITRPLTIDGNDATIVRPNTAPQPFRLLYALGGFAGLTGSLEVQDTVLLGGFLTANGQHGAQIASLGAPITVRSSSLGLGRTNAGRGGSIAVSAGSLTVEDSTIGSNVATIGGALYTAGSPVTVRRSTLSTNATTVSSGAVFQEGGTGTYENDTFAGNVTTNPGSPTGGLVVGDCAAATCGTAQPGIATVRSATFADNGLLGSPDPGIALTAFGANVVITVEDTIVTDTDSTTANKPGCLRVGNVGQIVDAGGNLEWPNDSCGFGTVADPDLAPLADNGGPTQTYRLLPSSPALELGGAGCPATDQRGEPRPGGDACDSGAYEANPPETTADGPDGPTNDPVVTFGADESPVSFECSVDDGPFEPCTSPLTVDEPDGTHEVAVRAVDGDGYTDPSPAVVVLTIDRTAPVVTVDPVASPTTDPTPDVTFTVDDDEATVECRVDDGAWTACSSPFTPGPLPDGEHTVSVRATDAAGNTGEDSVTFTVDATPPETTITSGPSGTVYNDPVTFRFTSSEAGSTFECQMDSGPWQPCTSPKTYSSLSNGTHTFRVRATDPQGNTDPTPATRTFTFRTCIVVTLFNRDIPICL